MLLHMEKTKNLSKLSFEFLFFVKTGLKPTPEANRNYDVTKMYIFETVLFLGILLFIFMIHCIKKFIWFPYVLFEKNVATFQRCIISTSKFNGLRVIRQMITLVTIGHLSNNS